jgi:uncharacterized membrane protein YfhO
LEPSTVGANGTYTPTPVVGYNQAHYSGEYHLALPGQVSQIEWTPNRLKYRVSATAPTELVVNQNYFPGWRLESGPGYVTSRDGILAVIEPAGRQEITLRFLPMHFALAVTLTLLGLTATIVLWKKDY